MKRLIFKYLSIICCTLAVSCTYEYEAEIPSNTNIIVIDGRLVTGTTSTIYISKATKLDGTIDTYTLRVSGKIECEDGTIINGTTPTYSTTPDYSSSTLPGYSVSSPQIEFDTRLMDPTKKYRVIIDAGEDGTFESEWMEVYKAPVIDDLHCDMISNVADSYLDFRVSAHSDSPYFAVSYVEAWEHTALSTTRFEYKPETNEVLEAEWTEHPYYRCWQQSNKPIVVISSAAHTDNKIDNAYLTKIDNNDIRISVLYRMIVTVASTSKQYYEYWDNLRKISYVNGDLFTPIPSNMEGNVHRKSGNGTVIGYLGASQAAIDTLYFKNNGFYRWPRTYSTKLDELMHFHRDDQFPDDLHQYYCPPAEEWPKAYKNGDIPIREASNEMGFIPNVYLWGSHYCVDCRFLGGDLTFPADWPDRNDPRFKK